MATPGLSALIRKRLLALKAAWITRRNGAGGPLERELAESKLDSVAHAALRSEPLSELFLPHLYKRLYVPEIKAVAMTQRMLLPESYLRLGCWELYYDYEPAGPVGGDYCDVVPQKSGELFLFIGDVMGKGFAGTKISSQLNGVLRALLDLRLPIEEMLERANRLFHERVQIIGYYATLVCGRASSAGTLELINAGHPPPLLLRSGAAERVVSTGLPLGLFDASKYEVTHIQLTPGETLLFYTDGVTEARNGSDIEYGVERLASFAAEKSHLMPRDLVRACRDDVSAFTSGAPLSDDLLLCALRCV
jgi:sigma-B regulation protein RsbU (phosphoserine phosphatase)